MGRRLGWLGNLWVSSTDVSLQGFTLCTNVPEGREVRFIGPQNTWDWS